MLDDESGGRAVLFCDVTSVLLLPPLSFPLSQQSWENCFCESARNAAAAAAVAATGGGGGVGVGVKPYYTEPLECCRHTGCYCYKRTRGAAV